MTRVFFITDREVDGDMGDTTHVRELFDNLRQFEDTYLVAPYAQQRPDHERILSVRADLVSIPVLRTVVFQMALLFHLIYQTVRLSPDAFYLRQSPLGVLSPFVAKAVDIPLVVEVNGILTEEHASSGKRPWFTKVIVVTEWITLRLSDRFVAVTPGIAEYIHSQHDVPKNRITHVPNGANVNKFSSQPKEDCRQKLGLETHTSFVCFVGNLAPWQGVKYLLQSAPPVVSTLPNVKLLIVGDGTRRDELKELTAELGLEDDVIFTGNVPYATVPHYINASDVCVAYKTPMKSGYSPIKLYEYMACGRPVIASDVKGFEVLEECNAGVLVASEDPGALTTTLIDLLQDDAIRERMGENGRRYAVEHRSWESAARKVADVIESVAGQR